MLKRKMLEKLFFWKKNKSKSALLLSGARQVGKTFIVREFAKSYKRFVEINFEKDPFFKSAFKTGSLSADTIIRNITALSNVGNLIQGDTLIFFDEIQSCPEARTAIKFLVEDGRYDYIQSGSLLGINYKEVSSYPVGFEEKIEMFPLDFEEFLWARNVSEDLISQLRNCFEKTLAVDLFVHTQMMKYFREYLAIGGMPAVVSMFMNDTDLTKTLTEQKKIVISYQDDIAKYAKRPALVKGMFDAIPEQLSDRSKRFIYSKIDQYGNERKYGDIVDWLFDAGIAYPCYNISALEYPLAFREKHNMFKLYLLDTGVLSFLSKRKIQHELFFGDIGINEGSIMENAIAGMLVKNGIKLNYYDRKSRMEIDFVYEDGNKISLIEVKSGKDYKRHASLDNASLLFGKYINKKIVLYSGNTFIDNAETIYMPFYFGMFIGR